MSKPHAHVQNMVKKTRGNFQNDWHKTIGVLTQEIYFWYVSSIELRKASIQL